MLRPFPPTPGCPSPWGLIQTVEPLGPEVLHVSTSSHGGFWLSPTAFERVPEAMRETRHSGHGWFEEDCDWALPYLALGLDTFEADASRAAERWTAAVRTVQKFHPQHLALLGSDVQAEAARHV